MAKTAAKPSRSSKGAFTGDERIVVLHGQESYLQIDYMHKLRAAIAASAGGDVEVIRHDGTRAALADILDDLRSYGLMQQHRLVVVSEADEFVKTHRQPLERYAAAPVDTATLLLRSEKWNKGKIDKLIEKCGRIIKCEKLSLPQVQKWLTDHASESYGLTLPARAATLLIDHLGAELGRLDTELAKLAVNADGGAVRTEDVEALVGYASDEKAFLIQDSLGSGNAKLVLEKLHELTDLSGQELVPISWAIGDFLRKAHFIRALTSQGENENAVCNQMKIFPFERRGPLLSAARKLQPARIARLMQKAINTDRQNKQGIGEPLCNIERLCVTVAETLR